MSWGAPTLASDLSTYIIAASGRGRPWESSIFSGVCCLGGELARERMRWVDVMVCSEVAGEGRGGAPVQSGLLVSCEGSWCACSQELMSAMKERPTAYHTAQWVSQQYIVHRPPLPYWEDGWFV